MDELSALREHGYEVQGRIGSGGMGTVYHAYQTAMKRDVAVKVLPDDLADNPNYFVRFNREAETLTQLEHPHIVPVYDYGTVGKTSYIVMRLLTGGSLNERLLKGDVLTLTETRRLVSQLASALNYAHAKNIIHRDIKASNVMLDEQGNAYLTDFGIAKLLDATGFTATGMMLGTPAYMAPEQWKGEDSSPQTDIYALGVLIYAILTGKLPFEAPTPYALMDKHLNEQPAPLTTHRPQLPGEINAVLDKALAKNPSQRYRDTLDLAQDFEQTLVSTSELAGDGQRTALLEEVATTLGREADQQTGEHPTTVVRAGERPFYRRPLVWLVSLLGLSAMGVGLFFALNGNGLVTNNGAGDDQAASSTAALNLALATDNAQASLDAQTAVAVAADPTDSPSSTPADTAVPSPATATTLADSPVPPTNTSTNTPRPTATHTSPPTTATATATPSPSFTPTFTATATSTFTATTTNTPPPTATPLPPTTAAPTLLPGLPGASPVTSNSQWTPIERTINGAPMVLVPAGSYTMGANDVQIERMLALCQEVLSASNCNGLLNDERQQLTITFTQPFWIDKTEVTNAIYNGGSGDDLPKTQIDWQQAQQHCQSRGARLPIEPEWEYAARGPDNLIFPWGNSWDNTGRANICDSNCSANWRMSNYNDGYAESAPVGSYPAGASWVGALDMGGNVWEWTSTIYRDYPYNSTDGREDQSNPTTSRTLRGGGWTWIAAETTTTARATHIQAGPYTTYYGFRCVRNFASGDLERYSANPG